MTCSKTQEFLARTDVDVREWVDARKETLKKTAALKLARQAKEIFSIRGKKVVHLDLRKENPSGAELAKLMLGPTGNLRAPTLRIGKTLIVGFDPATYERTLA